MATRTLNSEGAIDAQQKPSQTLLWLFSLVIIL